MIDDDFRDLAWADPEFIKRLPRALVFVDLPPGVRIVPSAFEKGDGSVTALYEKYESPTGATAPKRMGFSGEDATIDREARERTYWKWFFENYSEMSAMQVLEREAVASGGIRWVDYRLCLDAAGHTVHLHLVARGRYDTGTFAYNFIKRGFDHGLRIVATLKSEPGLNVLAVFER